MPTKAVPETLVILTKALLKMLVRLAKAVLEMVAIPTKALLRILVIPTKAVLGTSDTNQSATRDRNNANRCVTEAALEILTLRCYRRY